MINKKCAAAIAAATALMMTVAGCAVGPDFHPPAAPVAQGYTPEPMAPHTPSADIAGGAAQNFVKGLDIPGQWWTLFHSQQLNNLIEQALKNNPNLQAAQAALRQARENVYAQEGSLLPAVSGTGTATRQQLSGAEYGQSSSGSFLYNVFNASVNASYTLDVWGGIRRQIESQQAQADYERFALEAAYLTLTANVVTAAVQEASLRAQIAATHEIIAAETEQVDIVRRQFELGGASGSDVLAQETALAQEKATLPPLEKQLEQERDLLRALTGHLPSDDIAVDFDMASLKLPTDLPVSLPSKLVEQRPDVREYEALLHEASAQVGVATANMLPQFTITAAYGSYSTSASSLLSPGTTVWSVAAGLTQPLFEGGALLHKRRAALAAYDQAGAQYRYTVLTAFQNVADSLRALQSDANSLKAQLAAERSADNSFEISSSQYRVGAITYLTLLNAQNSYQQTRINLIQALAIRYADTAALFQALGGGWWSRSDVAPETMTWVVPATTWKAIGSEGDPR
jgi:NodT family efflux transporter outer membrane factor (OMF) lipoprotein